MTLCSSPSTRILIDRTLICNAILYHFQITLICGRTNRLFIPLTLFLLSRPLEQLEFIRFSNFQQKYGSSISSSDVCYTCPTENAPTQLPKSISTTSLQSKTSFSNHPRETISSPSFLVSVFTSYKNFRSFAFNLGRICVERNIVALHDHTPTKNLSPRSAFSALASPLPTSFVLSLARSRGEVVYL